MNCIKRYLDYKQNRINAKNRERLTNRECSIIASNCAGGIIYHWLGIRFNSPFINLYMTNEDFVSAMANFDEFIKTEIVEDKDSNESYPIGIGLNGVKIHFMHYKTFKEANEKWIERCKRININNLCIIMSNWGGQSNIVQQFDELPFEHKIIFTNKKFPNVKSVVYLKKWRLIKKDAPNNIWFTQNIYSGKRYIDQFDYISFFNRCGDEENE